MVGQNESKLVAWIWLHRCLGYNHVYFLDLEVNTIDCNIQHEHEEYHEHEDEANTMMLSYLSKISYLRYLETEYSKHSEIIDLISIFCGHLCGWKEPWQCYESNKLYSNLKWYKKILSYPSQSLQDDENNETNRQFYAEYNKNNILSDCILVSTKYNGYWLGNILNGNWYELGMESPYLKNLHNAIQRGSMCIDLFPRSDRLYFSGGLVCSMPMSTVVELDIDSMKLGILNEMQYPRAYLSMTFYPDSLIFIGGTDCWNNVYSIVEKYDLLEKQWYRLKKIKYPRYGHYGITINERYIFITGGCDRFYSVMNCELYDRKCNKWNDYGSMLKPAQKCHALKYKNDIFVIGAKDRTVQIFNFEKKQWRFGNKLNYVSSKKGCKLCTIDYKLIAMNKDNISKYEIYDENRNRWYSTDIRNHPIHKIYPKPFMFDTQLFDWFHLGRRYW